MKIANNVLGDPLVVCSSSPVTGIHRNGECDTDGYDQGVHVVCAQVTEDFLSFTRTMGNDLSCPAHDLSFPGLRPGDRWCLRVSRWKEAHEAVVLSATHEKTLAYVDLVDLREHSMDD